MSSPQANPNRRTESDTTQASDWLEVVQRKAEALRFGAVHITIHEGRVTQVESVERTRFTAPTSAVR